MTTHFHVPPRHSAAGHPQAPHLLMPLRRFAVGHPYASDWLLLTAGTLAALLLWLLSP